MPLCPTPNLNAQIWTCSSDVTTTSTTFASIMGGAPLVVPVNSVNETIHIMASVSARNNSANKSTYWRCAVTNAGLVYTNYLVGLCTNNLLTNYEQCGARVWQLTGLTPALYTLDLQWRISATVSTSSVAAATRGTEFAHAKLIAFVLPEGQMVR
jgi:hypothetical protein